MFDIQKKRLRLFVAATVLTLISFDAAAAYLTAKGSRLYNDKGEAVRLTGVNWFGFETTNMFPHGLWARDYHGVLRQIRQMGFNCIRIPYCNEMLRDDAKPDKPNFFGEDPYFLRDKTEFNMELAGLTPLQMLDEIIDYARTLGLVVILDNHSREHDGYMNEKLWYTSKTSEQIWIDDWVMLAKRYKGNPAVVGFDLENEPHGKMVDNGSTWGTGNTATDWNIAAEKCGNAILAANPDLLIIIEGVEQYGSTTYWWGGNLRGVEKKPIRLSDPAKLVYSPHEYGPEVFQQPWFFEAGFPANMERIWDEAFGFIAKKGIAPLLVGEFGISSVDSYGGKAGIWFSAFVKYMADNFFSWTFWALNPNSGDTGGMLSNDWVSVVQWKLDGVKSLCAPLINEPISVENRRVSFTGNRTGLLVRSHQLTVTDPAPGAVRISLVNLQGRCIRAVDGRTISLTGVASGVYSVLVTMHGNAVRTAAITIQ
jgi:aryl-phospho-beta-D-glucosidase BglC (GH1 family)